MRICRNLRSAIYRGSHLAMIDRSMINRNSENNYEECLWEKDTCFKRTHSSALVKQEKNIKANNRTGLGI